MLFKNYFVIAYIRRNHM